MDNETPNEQPEMTDEDFGAAVKRLRSHAENQADQAFKSGDRKRFDLWDTRAAKLKSQNFPLELTSRDICALAITGGIQVFKEGVY